jgi:hypothetical protein
MSPNPLPSPPETLRLVGPVIRKGVRRFTVWVGYTPRSIGPSIRVIRHLSHPDPIIRGWIQDCLDLGGFVTSINELADNCILVREQNTCHPRICHDPTEEVMRTLDRATGTRKSM